MTSSVSAMVAALILSASTASATDQRTAAVKLEAREAVAASCQEGVVLDDGVFESAYRIPFASSAQFVQKVTPPSYPALLTQVCSCWATDGARPPVSYSAVVYDDNGAAGQPGTKLGSIPDTAAGLPAGAFDDAACTPLGVVVEDGSIFVGVDWNAAGTLGVFVCSDESLSTPQAAIYQSASGGATWSGAPAAARALGLRAEFGAGSACLPTSESLCLNKGRFLVEATFQAGSNPTGTANVVKLTDETGYLWFFNSSNVEAVVKVIDACALNGKFWVFAGGLTDVRVDLTVTDTETGNFKTYTNPQGKPFQPIQDTGALPCN